MDFHLLRTAATTDLALYLRSCASRHGTEAVTEGLLAGIREESLPPRIFAIWATASSDPQVIRAALRQHFSRLIRRSVIARFRRWLRGSRLGEAWASLGGTSGILEFLAQASVMDVRHFCRAVGKSASSRFAREERQRYVEELFMALNPRLFPNSRLHTSDRRPLRAYYVELLPACSVDFLEKVRNCGDDKIRRDALNLCRPFHLETYREQALREMVTGMGSINDLVLLAEMDDDFHTDPAAGPRMSANMRFVMNFLGILSVQAVMPDAFDHAKVCSQIIVPLFRRLCRRRSPASTFTSAVEMLAGYHKHIPLHQHSVRLEENGILWYTVCRWAQAAEVLSEPLAIVLRLVRSSGSQGHGIMVAKLLRLSAPRLRYKLLRSILQHTPIFQTDIEVDDELQSFRYRWHPDIFKALPKSQARSLLERLIKLRPADTYAHWISDDSSLRTQHAGDPTCLLLSLSNEDSGGKEQAAALIEERKKKAVGSRQQTDRALWAGCACDCAIASGSVDLYRDTVFWATDRFARDPLTLQDLHSANALHTEEGIRLLRGFPGSKHEVGWDRVTKETVRDSVIAGNETCMALFESACSTLEEPSFNASKEEPVLELLAKVVHSRIGASLFLQKILKLEDDTLFDVIWRDTLEVLLQQEAVGLQERAKDLNFARVGGPLERSHELECHKEDCLPPATLRFIDQLAQRRDELWANYRRREKPELLSLPSQYPRGLPIQSLIPIRLRRPQKGNHLHYLRGRAEQAVFINAESAMSPPMSESGSMKGVVGVFIDDWEAAFDLYINTSDDPKQDALLAWGHATTALSAQRMSHEEALFFWSGIFTSLRLTQPFGGPVPHGPWNDASLREAPASVLPIVEAPDRPTEWDPDSCIAGYEIQSRKLDTKCIDEMLRAFHSPWATITELPTEALAPTIERDAGSIWSRYKDKRISPSAQEALIAASLLLNGEANKVTPNILKAPFFSSLARPPRFPSLFLAEEFLEKYKDSTRAARLLLEKRLIDNVPPSLLLQLVQGTFSSEQDASISRVSLILLRLLSKGDNPDLSLKLIQWLVLERPENSGWHRWLFRKGLFQVLSADSARQFAENMALSIQEKLAQGRTKMATGDAESGGRRGPVVKVTTVKMLAQILSDAEFVDEATTIRILTHLLRDASHLDIRVAAIEGMTRIIRLPSDPVSKETIFDTLVELVLPMMSGINERHLMTEEDWASAEASPANDLPEVYSADIQGALPPITNCIVTLARSANVGDDIKRGLFVRLLLPALRASIETNTRWLKLFFKHFNFTPVSVPALPVFPKLLLDMLHFQDYIPASLLDVWFDFWKFRNNPPAEAQAIEQYFSSDSKRLQSNAGQHWLSLHSGAAADLKRFPTPISLLTRKLDPKVENGIDLAGLQQLAIKVADSILSLLQTPNDIESYWVPWVVWPLTPRSQKDLLSLWSKQCRPVVEALVTKIDALRTSTWQRDLQRMPKVLPSTFQMRLWLVMHPTHSPTTALEIVDGTSELLNELGDSGRLYSDRFDAFKAFVLDRVVDAEKIRFLLLLSERVDVGRERMATADYLRLELISEMIAKVRVAPSGADKAAVRSLLDTWGVSPDEDVRMAALKLGDQPVASDGKKPWYCW